MKIKIEFNNKEIESIKETTNQIIKEFDVEQEYNFEDLNVSAGAVNAVYENNTYTVDVHTKFVEYILNNLSKLMKLAKPIVQLIYNFSDHVEDFFYDDWEAKIPSETKLEKPMIFDIPHDEDSNEE